MTATERLRAMLDERGVEWVASGTDTCWRGVDGYPIRAWETTDGTHMRVSSLTPEQAIAATMGHSLNNPSMSETLSERGTCEMKCDEFGTYYCSECGAYEIAGHRDDHAYACMPFYCPNCGRRVVDE